MPCSNRIVTFACVVCPVCYHAAELLVWWNLIEQIWQNGCILDAITRDLDCPYLQRLRVYPDMYLAPQATFGTTMLAGVPFSLAFSFDARAVDKQVQRSG